MRIYIDTSALCCEFDDQTIEANSRDSSAVQHILGLVKLGVWELCDSGVLRDEIGDDPWKLRKMASRKSFGWLRLTRASPTLLSAPAPLPRLALRRWTHFTSQALSNSARNGY